MEMLLAAPMGGMGRHGGKSYFASRRARHKARLLNYLHFIVSGYHVIRTHSLFLILIILILSPAQRLQAQDCVILLHGLARSDASMDTMAERLQDEGYLVVNHDYPSTDFTIEELSRKVIPEARAQCPDGATIHFVGHSLGAILVRYFLKYNELEGLGRVVMLGPPNKGSHVVDEMGSFPGFELINGPAGLQLGTDKNSIPNRLGPANFEVGIIAGTSTINLILSTMLPNPDDGKVSVASTRLEGMKDHITVPVSHPFLMSDDDVIEQTLFFLRHGFFREIKDTR